MGAGATPKGTSNKPRADTSRRSVRSPGRRRYPRQVMSGLGRVLVVDGQDCLDKVADVAPDVITLDVMMPRLDGWETARQLRKSPETEHIKVVLITARAQEDDMTHGASVGADAYLTKPFDPGEMIRLVRELAGAQPA